MYLVVLSVSKSIDVEEQWTNVAFVVSNFLNLQTIPL